MELTFSLPCAQQSAELLRPLQIICPNSRVCVRFRPQPNLEDLPPSAVYYWLAATFRIWRHDTACRSEKFSLNLIMGVFFCFDLQVFTCFAAKPARHCVISVFVSITLKLRLLDFVSTSKVLIQWANTVWCPPFSDVLSLSVLPIKIRRFTQPPLCIVHPCSMSCHCQYMSEQNPPVHTATTIHCTPLLHVLSLSVHVWTKSAGSHSHHYALYTPAPCPVTINTF